MAYHDGYSGGYAGLVAVEASATTAEPTDRGFTVSDETPVKSKAVLTETGVSKA